MQEAGGAPRGCRDHLHWLQASLHHQLHFPMSEVAGETAWGAAIRAKSIGHTRVRKGFKIALRGAQKAWIHGEIRIRAHLLLIGRALQLREYLGRNTAGKEWIVGIRR